MGSYEIFDHTADVGLRIRGRQLSDLFVEAARGLFDLMTDPKLPAGNPLRAKAHFSLHAENASELLLGWLRELLFTFSTKRYVLLEYNFTELTDQTLVADAQGFIFDPKRHDQKCEIKAVTYHNFKLEKIKEGFVAEIIFDI